jgi:uncharacterized protein (DUF983 family)
MVVVACLVIADAANCDVGRRVDVPDLLWSTVIGCVVTAPTVMAHWTAANPQWRIVKTLCVPTLQLPDLLSELDQRPT